MWARVVLTHFKLRGTIGKKLVYVQMADGRRIGVSTRLPVCNGDMEWSGTCYLGKVVSAVLGFPWGERRVAPDPWVRVGNATKRNSPTETCDTEKMI